MKTRFSGRALVLAALGLLAIWLSVWLGVLTTAADTNERILWLCLPLLPLAIVSYHVWRERKAGFACCGFLALGYLAQGVTTVLTSKSDAGYASMEVFLSLLLFTAASAALRAGRQHAR